VCELGTARAFAESNHRFVQLRQERRFSAHERLFSEAQSHRGHAFWACNLSVAFCKSEESAACKGPAQPLTAKLCSRVGRGFQDKMFKLYTGQSLHEVCPTLTNELAHKSLGGFPQCLVLPCLEYTPRPWRGGGRES